MIGIARTRDWRRLVWAKMPLCVSAVCSVLMVAEIANLTWILRPEPAALAPTSAARTNRAPLFDSQSIVSAHLFGTPAVGATDEAAVPELAEAHLVLEGTIAGDDPHHGVAIIAHDAVAQIFAVGALVQGAALHAVYTDHVILDRNGVLRTLSLPYARNPTRGLKVPTYVDNLGRTVDKPPGVLDKILRTVGSMDKAQKMQGLTVYPIGSGAPLRALGLFPGDMLVSINGKPLDDLKSSREILDGIESSEQLPATIMRQGQTLSVLLDLAEATRQANSPPQG